jgi:hypothetical protein
VLDARPVYSEVVDLDVVALFTHPVAKQRHPRLGPHPIGERIADERVVPSAVSGDGIIAMIDKSLAVCLISDVELDDIFKNRCHPNPLVRHVANAAPFVEHYVPRGTDAGRRFRAHR